MQADQLCGCTPVTEYLASSNNTCVTVYTPDPGFHNDGYNLMTACHDTHCKICESTDATGCTECMANFELLADKSCYCSDETFFLDASTQSCIQLVDCGAGFYNDG